MQTFVQTIQAGIDAAKRVKPSQTCPPTRVQRAFEREQYRSELLVTAVQLLITAILAVLYVSAPPGFPLDAPIRVVPLGLTLFGLLTLVRLYLAVTGQLTRWMVGVTVVGEMALLMFVIWAYHLQYEQPAQFYLKSTEFVYVFILIALRALRLEPVWVALSGCTAASAWLLLLHYALVHSPGNAVTWDYVTASRSFQIHYGSEFDKMLAILMVTAVLAFALSRARRFVLESVSGHQAVADLSLFFDDSVAHRITQSEVQVMPGHGDLRDAAILFLDLRGFTQASAMSGPSELIALLGEYQRLVVPIIKAHHGSVDKFMGDGILASFGAVTPDRHHAANVLRAVDAIFKVVDAWRTQRRESGKLAPDVGAGVANGPIVFGVIGDETRLEYTVIGDAVNLAAKLEKHNKTEGTRGLATRVAYETALVQGYDSLRDIATCRMVGGVAQSVDLAILARDGASRSTSNNG